MKLFILLAAFVSLNTFAAKAEYYTTTINWDAKHLEDSTVLMCDDTYLSGVEIEIPGNSKFPEDRVSFQECGVDWKLVKKTIIEKNGKSFNVLRFKGGSPCTMEVSNGKYQEERKVFTLDISDAC